MNFGGPLMQLGAQKNDTQLGNYTKCTEFSPCRVGYSTKELGGADNIFQISMF